MNTIITEPDNTPEENRAMDDVEIMLDEALARAGAVAWGVARSMPVAEREMQGWRRWIAEGRNAGMEYMERHEWLRMDPEGLLPGCGSVVSVAFNYTPAQGRDMRLPRVASFAYGMDYHDVLRKRLSEAVEGLRSVSGGEWRICIDSAPVFERYWAQKCGVGTRADNGLIYVRPYGTRILLAEILTTLELSPYSRTFAPGNAGQDAPPCQQEATDRDRAPEACIHCGACRRVCPAGALQEDSTVDARRCLSYLTVEHRDAWDAAGEEAMRTPAGRRTLFGCDLCQDVCPLNRLAIPTRLAEFSPIPIIASGALTRTEALGMSREDFSKAFRGSPVKRAKLAGLRRNAGNLDPT